MHDIIIHIQQKLNSHSAFTTSCEQICCKQTSDVE